MDPWLDLQERKWDKSAKFVNREFVLVEATQPNQTSWRILGHRETTSCVIVGFWKLKEDKVCETNNCGCSLGKINMHALSFFYRPEKLK